MQYDLISRLNHWIIAITMIGTLLFGLCLAYGGLEREARGLLIGIHRSVGILVLIYGAWRVAWRMISGAITALRRGTAEYLGGADRTVNNRSGASVYPQRR
ncbi:cytochrome b/b6 domain-containing protein [uncultured Roseobacter sp.]|uniref:cytochrome b n=1 Tax=uncultured Roseobacter sp. TaxID=114847 RepID=UPI00261890D7|nr:cytochrome b/b6 domain-containing protein [uncultured Roseobacter sp.]